MAARLSRDDYALLDELEAGIEPKLTLTERRRMSAVGRTADIICSQRVFRLLTHQRHWLCTAAMVLMPVSAPIKVLA
jgi:hypothetical protein